MQVNGIQTPGYVGSVQAPEAAARAAEPAQTGQAQEPRAAEAQPVETAEQRGGVVDVQA